LGLHIGDLVPVGTTPGHTAKVVGSALLPSSSHTDYDQSAWLTAGGLQAAVGPTSELIPNVFEDYLLIKWADGANVAAAERRLSGLGKNSDAFQAAPASLPLAVVSLGELRSLPLALGVFFALLATATVAHALVTTVRRRRHELAVLRSLGFTRRQTRLAIAWQATLIAAAGVIVGVPSGIVAGRLVWRWLADSFPVVYVPPLAVLAMVLVVPAAILLANLLAAVPARSAARIRPAEALRTE
jgi:ABC-type antimicrobial peptide transport system permease subunit